MIEQSLDHFLQTDSAVFFSFQSQIDDQPWFLKSFYIIPILAIKNKLMDKCSYYIAIMIDLILII